MKEDAGWGGSASFEGKSFDSVHWFGCEGCFKVSPVFKYIYSGYLKVLLWFVFAIYVFFLFMVNWKEVCSEPCIKSEAELFAKQVNNLKPLISLKKILCLDVWKGSEYTSAAWKANCKFCYILQFQIACIFCHFSTTRLPLEMLSTLAFLRP